MKIKKTKSSPNIWSTQTNLMNNTYWANDKNHNINLNKSQKILLNSFILHSGRKSDRDSSKTTNGNLNNSLLYDDLITLKNKINKLKSELSFLKSEDRKKEEEIKKVQNFMQNSKNKIKEKKYIQKLKEQNQMIKLKETYQKLQSQIKEKIDENNIIYNKIKTVSIEELNIDNMNNTNIFKDKIKEYREILSQNKKREQELNACYVDRELFFKNHSYLEKLLKEVKKKNEKINYLKNYVQILKDKYNKTN